MGADYGVDMELFTTADIVGRETLDNLKAGNVAHMRASAGQSWTLKQLSGDYVLALKSMEPQTRRSGLEWAITGLFYAAIALVIHDLDLAVAARLANPGAVRLPLWRQELAL